MSEGPLDAWSGVTECFVQFAFSVTQDRDIISLTGTRVGTGHTWWQVVASGRLSGGSEFVAGRRICERVLGGGNER